MFKNIKQYLYVTCKLINVFEMTAYQTFEIDQCTAKIIRGH